MFMHQKRNETARLIVSHGQFIRSDHSSNCRAVRLYHVLSSEYIYSKWTYFPEAQQFTKHLYLLVLSILICWDCELVGFCWMWAQIITIKITKDLNYFSLCALN